MGEIVIVIVILIVVVAVVFESFAFIIENNAAYRKNSTQRYIVGC
jgi:hypothetical protein